MRPSSIFYSLRVRTILAFTIIVFILISFQVLYIAPKEQSLIRVTLLNESKNTLGQVNAQLVSPILKRQLAALYEIIDNQMSANPYWHRIRILDNTGRQIYPLTEWTGPVNEGDFLLQSDITFLDESIAHVDLVVNYMRRLEASRDLQNQLAYFQLLFLGCILVLAFFTFERIVFKPLNMLSTVLRNMASGSFDHPLPNINRGEIGVLVKEFSASREAIKTYQQNLVTLKQEADRANAFKSEFLSRMSHELRTPLNSIIGFSELCLEESHITPSNHESLQAINKSGHHLLNLIDEILELTRIEAGYTRIKLGPVHLGDMLDDCEMFIKNFALSHKIKVDFMPLPAGLDFIIADPTRLKQCVLNLLSNAVKYNRHNGVVTVNCRATGEGRVRIDICDDGPGLSTQQIEQAFRPFERLAMHAENTEGTGIGLAITQQLVTMMNGTLGAFMNPLQGSTFWIELPQINSHTPVEKTDQGQPEIPLQAITPAVLKLKSAKILIAEDNELNRKILRAQLAALGYNSTVVNNGTEALACYENDSFDLLITDIMMPGMNGYELVRRIREYEASTNTHLTIVALSANALETSKQEAFSAQVDDYLTKPMQKKELQAVLDKFLTPD